MATRRTPPRRRQRDEDPGTRNVLIGGSVLVLLGLFIGTLMGRHSHSHTPSHPAHHAAVTVASTPTLLPLVSLLPPVRPQIAPSARPASHATPKSTPTPLKSSPKPTTKPTPIATMTPLPTAMPSPSPSPHAVRATAPAVPTAATMLPETQHTRYPVTAAMLAGATTLHHPRVKPHPPATLAPTAQPTAAPTASASATPIVHHAVHVHAKPTPVVLAHHWHPKPHPSVHTVPNDIFGTPAPVTPVASAKSPQPITPVKILKTSAQLPVTIRVHRAESVVRAYLQALIRGDEPSAYHALGGAPGDSGLSLSEENFIDHSAHVASIMSQVDETGSNVQAEVAAKHGLYFVTFRVENHHGRAVITSHDFIKP